MWGVIKLMLVAAGVGVGAGVLAKGKIDTAINGEPPKKIPKKKFQIIELPDGVEIEQIDVVVKKTKETLKKEEDKKAALALAAKKDEE